MMVIPDEVTIAPVITGTEEPMDEFALPRTEGLDMEDEAKLMGNDEEEVKQYDGMVIYDN